MSEGISSSHEPLGEKPEGGGELFEPAYEVPAVRYSLDPDNPTVEHHTFSSGMTVDEVARINAHSVEGCTPLIIPWSALEKYIPKRAV